MSAADGGLHLVGDVGGTKTRLAIVSPGTGPHELQLLRSFHSSDYPNFVTLATHYLSELPVAPLRGCFGVPGPVLDGRAKLTNLPWIVDQNELCRALGLSSALLLNDVQAAAASVPHLRSHELHTIHAGAPSPTGTIAVVAPGTGIGQAFLTWDGSQHRAHASEGGHSHFSPVTADDALLWAYLRETYGRVSVERVCSGSGIPNVYAFLLDSGRFAAPDWWTEMLASADDPTAAIVNAALNTSRPCAICQETLAIFVHCLAAESANLALKVMATGGVYLAGGIPPRIRSALDAPAFIKAFRSMGRYADLMERIPLHIVLHPQPALVGAAFVALAETK